MQYLQNPEEGVGSFGAGVIGSSERPDMGAGDQSGPLQEQCVLLTA